MTGDDVHLVGILRADLRAVHLFAWTRGRGLHVQLAQFEIGLFFRVVIDAGRSPVPALDRTAAAPAAARAGLLPPAAPAAGVGARPRLVLVRQTLRVRAAITFQLRLDPVDRGAVPVGALSSIPELRQALDRPLVLFQLEAFDQGANGILRRLLHHDRRLREKNSG